MEFRTTVCCGLVLSWLLVVAPAWSQDDLTSALDAALGVRGLRGAEIGALVVARDDGRVLYARNADQALIPASNQKLLTALATLAAFGPQRHFPIDVYADAPPDAEGAVANLYLRATGDATLTSEDYWRLAADLRLAGVRKIEGDLVIDDSAFDSERWNPIWGETSSRAYHAPVGAFTANYGAFTVVVVPGADPGAPAVVRVDPPVPYLELVNKAVTGSRRKATGLKVQRAAHDGRERIEVSGVIREGSDPAYFRRAVIDAVAYAASVLRMQLRANGISVEGGLQHAAPPAEAFGLLSFQGNSVARIVQLFMKYSNNGIAESMVKALGANATGEPGSWKNGIPALRAELAKVGIAGEGLVIVDGSGLSYENRVSAQQLVDALCVADRDFAIAAEFAASLPVAAGDGTLEKRLDAVPGKARAKTGLLTSVTALSGFAVMADGSQVAFSLLVNGFRSTPERAMAALDAFVVALADRRPPVAPPAPAAAHRLRSECAASAAKTNPG